MTFKNSSLDGTDYFYQPPLKGGSISYKVDLSTVGCGCTAGIYAVNVSSYCNAENGDLDNPMCASMDIMQANHAGFQTQMHPCSNGTCDVVSKCSYTMAKEGAKIYGEKAYGYGGSIIDTKKPFAVQTDFVTKGGYTNLWKVRSTLTQDSRTLKMEADCTDYIDSMTSKLDGGMSLTFSTWRHAGRSTDLANFEDKTQCPTPKDECDGAAVFSSVKVTTKGFDEEPRPEPTPEPEPKPEPKPEPTPEPEPKPEP